MVSAADTVMITVASGFRAPVAHAGPDQDDLVSGPTVGAAVTLDGSRSAADPRRTIRSWNWTQTGGPAVNLANEESAEPSFTAGVLADGADNLVYTFSLEITDSADVVSAADTVMITVASGFRAPVAHAGPDQDDLVSSPTVGAAVTLDGSRSAADPRRTIRSWNWTQTGGPAVNLANEESAEPSFTAGVLADGADNLVYTFSLEITDSADVVSAADTVMITVASGFRAPVAHAGPDQDDLVSSPTVGAAVTLDGSRSAADPRRTIRSWNWTQTGGPAVNLANEESAEPSFTAGVLADGADNLVYTFSLEITDSADVVSAADTVMITVASGFRAPVAHAGPDQDDLVSSPTVGAAVTLDGSRSAADPRRTIRSWNWTQTGGPAVNLANEESAEPSFTAGVLADGADNLVYTFSLEITDSADVVSAADTVMITVASGFRAPVAHAGPDQDDLVSSPTVGAAVTLDGSRSAADPRRTIRSWNWTQTGGPAVNLANEESAEPSFTAGVLADGADNLVYTFSLEITDSADVVSAADTVMITVASGFRAPVAHAGPDQDDLVSGPTVGAAVTLDGSRSAADPRRTIRSWNWTQTGGPDVNLANEESAEPSFTAGVLADGADNLVYTFSLEITDSADVVSAADTVMITVASGFRAPVAHAGPDQDDLVSGPTVGAAVTLDGSRSAADPRRTIRSWNWTQTGGPDVNLANEESAEPSFTAGVLADGADNLVYTFSLEITDSADVVSAADTVMITVASGFRAPVAHAGPDQDDLVSSPTVGAAVTLDGSRSAADPRRTIRSWNWTQTGGPDVNLANEESAEPSFTAGVLADGADNLVYTFSLEITDSADVVSAADTVMITVASGFRAPVAHAGPDQDDLVSGPTVGAAVTLDGSRSAADPRRTIRSWNWTQTGGPAVNLANEESAEPSFTAGVLADGADNLVYTFSLEITDSADVVSAADTVMITVASGFRAPVAHAGPDQDDLVSSPTVGAAVTLDGSRSAADPRRTIRSWNWTQTGGPAVNLANEESAEPSFTAGVLADGADNLVYTFSLEITDSADVVSAADTVMITVASGFRAPVAHAGPDQDDLVSSPTVGAAVTLDGSRSAADPRRTIRSWNWTQTNGPAVTLDESVPSQPSFTAGALDAGAEDVIYIFSLIITDSEDVTSESDEVTITVTSGIKPPISNAPPVADAGEDQKVASKTTVTLDGSGSTDSDGAVEFYSWRRTAGTGGDIVVLANENTPQMRFTADALAPGADDVTHIFQLVVTDNEGAKSKPDTVTVTVSAVPLLASIRVSPSELTVQEGGSSAYQVRLSRFPGQAVTIEAASDNEDVVLNNAHLLFNAENWGVWQNVRISTVADTDKADDKALIRHRFVGGGVAVDQSGVVSVTVREVDPILRPVGEHLAKRASALLNSQRKLIPFLKRDETIPGGSKELTLNATNDLLALDGGFVRDGIWGEVTGSYTRGDSGDLKSVLGSFGLHWKNSERFLAGVMLQFDLAENDLAGRAGSIDGAGWLAGPYFAVRHGTQPLYFEGRLLYGQSDNDFSFHDPDLGERRGSFDTRRLLAQIRMEGEIALSDRDDARLIPYADARWIKERAKGFTDSVGNRVPGQKVGIGHLEFGSRLEIPFVTTHGAMTFIGGLGMVYSNTEADYVRSESRGRGRGEMGISYDRNDNVRIDFESFYDGIGASENEIYGLSLNAEMKF